MDNWVSVFSRTTGKMYWRNKRTNATTWTCPLTEKNDTIAATYNSDSVNAYKEFDEKFFVLGTASSFQCDNPLETPIYVCSDKSELFTYICSRPDKSVVHLQNILYKRETPNAIGEYTDTSRIIYTWDMHPEVRKTTLSAFSDFCAATVHMKQTGRYLPRPYFHDAGYVNENRFKDMDLRLPSDIQNASHWGYQLKNSVADSVMFGGKVGLFLLRKKEQSHINNPDVGSICAGYHRYKQQGVN